MQRQDCSKARARREVDEESWFVRHEAEIGIVGILLATAFFAYWVRHP
jgi:hypothetical protein